MPSSQRYLVLRRRIGELRRHLLPRKFDPTGSYTKQQYDATRAFVSLTHAEIEAFLEDICIATANASINQWQNQRVSNNVIFSLYAMCYTRWSDLENISSANHKAPPKDKNIEVRLACAGEQYKTQVDKNHGLKEKHLRTLLVPLGIRIDRDLHKDWVKDMSVFGGHRGRIVHMQGSANRPPDPKEIRDLLAESILPGLKRLDEILQNLTGSHPQPPKRRLLSYLAFWRY